MTRAGKEKYFFYQIIQTRNDVQKTPRGLNRGEGEPWRMFTSKDVRRFFKRLNVCQQD
jgi:hypothetical protein